MTRYPAVREVKAIVSSTRSRHSILHDLEVAFPPSDCSSGTKAAAVRR